MKPHVAFLPSPGMGHIIPLFLLARRISLNHGYSVSFLVITTKASTAQTRFFQQQSNHLPEDFRFVSLPPADEESSLITDDMPVVVKLCTIVQESLKPLKSILRGMNPNALIIDLFTTEAIDVCNELTLPVYSFFPSSVAFLAYSLCLPTLDKDGTRGFAVNNDKPVMVPGCRPIAAQDVLDLCRHNHRDDYKPYWLHVTRLHTVSGIFTNTFEALNPSYLNAFRGNEFFTKIPIPPIYPIGPLTRDEFLTEQDHEIIAWLQNQPPDSVLFISFGSGGALTMEELTELATGLEMSKQRFILVVRKPRDVDDAYAGMSYFDPDNGMDPSAYLPHGFVERTRGIGLLVANWAPQVAVLRNPSTGGFLSHCGWNSALESLAHGVPIIACPLYAEQAMNATLLVEEIGAAVRVAALERKEVERAIRAVMEGEEGKGVRKRAKELEESAGKALGCGGSSFNALSGAMETISNGAAAAAAAG